MRRFLYVTTTVVGSLVSIACMLQSDQPVVRVDSTEASRVIGGACTGETTLNCPNFGQDGCRDHLCAFAAAQQAWVCNTNSADQNQNTPDYNECTTDFPVGLTECGFPNPTCGVKRMCNPGNACQMIGVLFVCTNGGQGNTGINETLMSGDICEAGGG